MKFFANSAKAWDQIWHEYDIEVEGNPWFQNTLRLHIFHTLSTLSPHNSVLDASAGPRGWSEPYRGHVFWDEIYMMPFVALHQPDVARSMLEYRYRRLDEARKYAAEYGHEGAMWPWQIASDGREQTQIVHFNPKSGQWDPDNSSRQRHVGLAVDFNIWTYYHLSNDIDFMEKMGAEMFLENCRYWASICTLNEATQRYSISGVMGPDEFHEGYPGAQEGGLKDNTYTNIMLAWALEKADTILTDLSDTARSSLIEKMNLSSQELDLLERY